MVRRVSFTEHEASLLLDAYLKVLSGELSGMESIQECSFMLHQMAVNAGILIDDTYRNISGISFQMASMESVYQRHTIIKTRTILFANMVSLYQNDIRQYQQLVG